MNKKLKGILWTLVVAFALVGAGGTVAFASGGLVFSNIQANYNLADKDLDEITVILKNKDTKITGLEGTLLEKEGLISGLETEKENLTNELNQANSTNGVYKEQIQIAIESLNAFNDSIDNTNGTSHKLTKALELITNLSEQFGTNVDLTELKDALKSAQQDNIDLDDADKLMKEVKDKTGSIIEDYSEEATQE